MIDNIKSILSSSSDYIFKDIIINKYNLTLIFNETLTSSEIINNLIFELNLNLKDRKIKSFDKIVPNSNVKIINSNNIIYYLNNGYLIILFKGNIYSCEVKANLNRGIPLINSELSIGGAKDSFNENINNNIGLIRRRIKSNLCNKTLEIGTITKTKVNILYVDSICDKKLVNNIFNKLNGINIDGILDSSYLKFSLEDSLNIFPTIIMTERPDKCSMALLEGKVIILVDNSPYALILPSFFIDFFHTPDDYYQKSVNTTFIRVIRLFAFVISVFTPAIYISITTRNYDLVPNSLLLMLKAGRTFVPFPAYIEAIFMIICFEILKESDLRMSTTSGSAVSILGGLILGDAAVAAGIVSPIMIIIIAISSIAGLVFTSHELVNALRIYKILLLILGSILGIYGVSIGLIFLIYNLYSTKIFGYKYFSLNKNELKDSFIKIDDKVRKRNSYLTKNIIRGRYK